MKIALLGISHLSLNHGAAFMEKGFDVVFFDFEKDLVAQVKAGTLDYAEPGLKEALARHTQKFQATDQEAALKDCDLLYIARDVPTDDQGKSDLRGTYTLFDIAKKNAFASAAIVILCQVPPGFTRNLDFPKERLFYHMDPLIFGQALDRAIRPDRFIMGLEHPKDSFVPALESLLTSFDCPILKMRYESAEFTKIAINLFLISSVSTTNTIADICEKIGADWFEMKKAVQLDKRIGPHAYINPGLGLSGGNLERSLTSAYELAYAHGAADTMVQAWTEDCTYRKDWVLKVLHQHVFPKKPAPQIGVLGLSYKIDTSSTKNSPSLHVLSHLHTHALTAFDPVVKSTPHTFVKIADQLSEVLEKEVVIIMTPWKEFKDIHTQLKPTTILIDPFNLLEPESHRLNCQYYALGRTL